MNDGKFISDEIIHNLIEKIILDPQNTDRLIFDGYPRTLVRLKI